MKLVTLHHKMKRHAIVASSCRNLLERVVRKRVANNGRPQVGVLGHEAAGNLLDQCSLRKLLLVGGNDDLLTLQSTRKTDARRKKINARITKQPTEPQHSRFHRIHGA
jgi:hypothetical protein